MVGSRSLDLVQRYADAAGAKVVLVGDNRQLSSIDAGGALRTLSRELGDPGGRAHHQPTPGRGATRPGNARPWTGSETVT